MNYPDPTAGPWCYHDNAGDATAAASGDTGSFADIIADYSTDDLFELMWQGGGDGASGSTKQPAPAVSCLCLSPRLKPAEVRFGPPSEDEMAAWLCAIVKGEELVCNDDEGRERTADGRVAPAKGSSETSTATWSTSTDKREKLPMTEGMGNKETGSDSMERRKPAGGSRSHHGETHNLTEKRRRHKINERLKTLQQLVPGCDKSNQASTLDQTIQYMKSLQHLVHTMSGRPAAAPATEVYPAVQPQYVPPEAPVAVPMPPPDVAPMVLGPPPMMVPFGPMLRLAHYAAAVMMPTAAPPPLYPAAAPPRVAPAAGLRRHGSSSSSSRGKGGRSSSGSRRQNE